MIKLYHKCGAGFKIVKFKGNIQLEIQTYKSTSKLLVEFKV